MSPTPTQYKRRNFIPNQRHNFWLERFKVPVSAHLWYALRTLVAEPSASYPALKNCSLRCKRDMGFAGCGETTLLQNFWKPKDRWVSNWIFTGMFLKMNMCQASKLLVLQVFSRMNSINSVNEESAISSMNQPNIYVCVCVRVWLNWISIHLWWCLTKLADLESEQIPQEMDILPRDTKTREFKSYTIKNQCLPNHQT